MRGECGSAGSFVVIRCSGKESEIELLRSVLAGSRCHAGRDLVLVLNGPSLPAEIPVAGNRVWEAIEDWLGGRFPGSRVLQWVRGPVSGGEGRLVIAEADEIGLILFFARLVVAEDRTQAGVERFGHGEERAKSRVQGLQQDNLIQWPIGPK